jgi:DNA-binding LacI/PurR family transcriptional regulator
MREAGLPVREFLPPRKLDPVEVAEALTAWLGGPQRPSALVTYCDIEVVALLHVAPVLKLRLPQDLTMVTFAEQPTHYGLAPVTTMLIPAEELGRVAVEMLMKKIAAPARALAPCPVPFGRHEGAACGRVSGDEMSRPKVS